MAEGLVFSLTSALTHVFEGEHDGCDDARHKHHDPKNTEKALTLGEVDLEGKLGHVLRLQSEYRAVVRGQAVTHTHICIYILIRTMY